MPSEFYIRKENGQFKNMAKWKDHCAALPDGNYKFTCHRSTKRSLQQNDWFHAVLPDILAGLREVGYNEIRTLDDAKDFIKSVFFRKSVTNGIDTVEIIEGTSAQSKLDFASKAEDIIIWASQYLGIDIAPPSQQLEIFE